MPTHKLAQAIVNEVFVDYRNVIFARNKQNTRMYVVVSDNFLHLHDMNDIARKTYCEIINVIYTVNNIIL